MDQEQSQHPQQPRRTSVELTSVATSTGNAFLLPDGRVLNIEEYLAWLGSMMYEIKIGVIG